MASDAPGALDYLHAPCSADTALDALAEPLRLWFRQRFGTPTAAQRHAWPTLAAGNNLLLCSPTGSGKTLAAFLPILDQLLKEPGASSVRCLYLTPLKALGNDLRTNLRTYLDELRPFLAEDVALRVGLRTGDTSTRVRLAQRLRPPDVLLTTPESLAVLLSQSYADDMFAGVRWVVVDEVHALAANKRGADLALSLERLADLTQDRIQRVGLSATCAPLAEAARFLVGVGRSCTIASVGDSIAPQLSVEPLPTTGGAFLTRLLARLEPELATNGTTLIFTNTRNLAERLAWALRRRFPDEVEQIAVHHSALAARVRRTVEQSLKQGRLRVVVSSTSLELGIDIGSVEGVVLVHPPGGVSRLLQRVGRGGHAPGRPCRGLVLTSTPAELLEAAVTGASSQAAQIEPLRTPKYPLDVLCQQLLGMAARGFWTAETAYDLVRRAFPFRDLPRCDFNDCIDYLTGRRHDGRSWLPTRLRWENDAFAIADERTARLLRRNLGTILAEETRTIRLNVNAKRKPAIGTVDDAFADRLHPGDRFLLDARCLEVRRHGHELLVDEVIGRPVTPRWTSDGWPLSASLAQRLYLLRVQAAEALREGPTALAELLRRDYGLEGNAVTELAAFFQRQEHISEIPDAETCLIEAVRSEGVTAYYLHTPLNRLGNDALARVVVLRLARERGWTSTSLVADLGFALFTCTDADLTPDDLRTLLVAGNFDTDLAQALAESTTLRQRFQRVAQTGLMVLRHPLGRRRKVGGHDWSARRLFDQVRAAAPDFVLLRQAEREVRTDCCDAESARSFVAELPRRSLRLRWLGRISPFAESWTQADAGPAEAVEWPDEALERLHTVLTGADG